MKENSWSWDFNRRRCRRDGTCVCYGASGPSNILGPWPRSLPCLAEWHGEEHLLWGSPMPALDPAIPWTGPCKIRGWETQPVHGIRGDLPRTGEVAEIAAQKTSPALVMVRPRGWKRAPPHPIMNTIVPLNSTMIQGVSMDSAGSKTWDFSQCWLSRSLTVWKMEHYTRS